MKNQIKLLNEMKKYDEIVFCDEDDVTKQKRLMTMKNVNEFN